DYVRACPVLDDVDLFDAAFFNFTPRDAELIDPQQRLFLECAWEALEDSGHDARQWKRPVGVFAAAGMPWYLMRNLLARGIPDDLDAYPIIFGNNKDHLSTRTSYKLDLRGPSVSVQTACSSSLVAVHLACRALLGGECDLALAGGVSILLPQGTGYRHIEGGIMSPDGGCRPFDADARGTIFGSGLGVVVLKRLVDARADRDTIHAVIKGSAINNDGSGKPGYAAPSVEGQAAAVRAAHVAAQVNPETIQYVEAHGTGTPIGDPIEIEALTLSFRAATQRRAFCAIGSVKANIGHLDTAAGIAGLIKTVLALRSGVIPPNPMFRTPNAAIDFASTPFVINAEAQPWPAGKIPRRAGVSSFGMGGTNAHVVLEEAPVLPPEPRSTKRSEQIIPLSARNAAGLRALAARMASAIPPDAEEALLLDIAHTLRVGRRSLPFRAAVVAGSARAAVKDIEAIAAGARTGEPLRGPVATVFAFSSWDAPPRAQVADLYGTEATFARVVDECIGILRSRAALDLRGWLFGGAADERRSRLPETAAEERAASFVVGYAIARTLGTWGVVPRAVVGDEAAREVVSVLLGDITLDEALCVVASPHRARVPPRSSSSAFDELARRTRAHEPGALWVTFGAASAPDDDDPGRRGISILPEAGGSRSASQHLLDATAFLWAAGVEIDWTAFDEHEPGRRVPLPTYSFERRRHWVESPAAAAPAAEAHLYEVAWKAAPVAADAAPGPEELWAVLHDGGILAERLLEHLDSLGVRAVRVRRGVAWERRSDLEFLLEPGDDKGYAALFEAIGGVPARIVHLWSARGFRDVAEAMAVGPHALCALGRAVANAGRQGPTAISVITVSGQRVGEDDSSDPLAAMAVGTCRALSEEVPGLAARVVDLEANVDPRRAVEHVMSERMAFGVVAYRSGARLMRSLTPLVARDPARGVALRRGGVFLITGGLGGLGLAIARHIALRTAGTVILTSRAGLRPDDGDESTRALSRTPRGLRALENNGARIEHFVADATDAEAMGRVIRSITDRHGGLHGVVHAAGVADGRLLVMRDPVAAESVLRPKVVGALVLASLLSERDLDFFVLFSSLASLFGGVGQADYCASNTFLDAFAQQVGPAVGRRIAINWDAWREVGMAADTRVPERFAGLRRAHLAGGIGTQEGVAAFERALAAGRRQVVVSCRDLDDLESSRRPMRAAFAGLGEDGAVPSVARQAASQPGSRNEIRSALTSLWEQAFGTDTIDPDQDFFDMGGDSMLAIQIVSRIRDELGFELRLQDVQMHRTITSLAERLESMRLGHATSNGSTLVDIQPEGDALPLFCVHPIGGAVFVY
ncbi:MAG TPA: SDR family NAD(P)-dependent oxidoreductase, partial [Polyangiaceae bacterium]|nr:SDR family NAD(P)-dependent oxidoreductase [Polyangiaceae bacterium]